MGLGVNEGKTKSILSASRDKGNINSYHQKMMSVGRSNVGSLLPTDATVVSIDN